jgi:MinD superfamily P-loop ATPase
VIAAIGGANAVLIVVEPTLSALHDMRRVIKLARHFDVPASVAINKRDLNLDVMNEIKLFCEAEKLPVVGTIPYDLDIVRAQMNGQTIMEFPNETLKKHFVAVWDQIRQQFIESKN